jgi:hypothetical protein
MGRRKSKNVKTKIIKYQLPIIVALLGALAGLSYWYFIGCANGSCGITANWHTSAGFGTLMGWFLGDILKDKINK